MHLEFAPEFCSCLMHGFFRMLFDFISYAFSDSLLLTPLCCDDIHDVTPWRGVTDRSFGYREVGYSIAYDSKEEPIEEEPLEEPNEEGYAFWLTNAPAGFMDLKNGRITRFIGSGVELLKKKSCLPSFPSCQDKVVYKAVVALYRSSQILVEDLLRNFGRHCRRHWEHGLNMHTTYHPQTNRQIIIRVFDVLYLKRCMEGSVGHMFYRLKLEKFGRLDQNWYQRQKIRVEVGDKVMLEVSSWKEVYWMDANLHVHVEEIKVDKTLHFVKEPVEIIDSYAFSDSLLLTPLCCDDIHDVTPRVSALAGCDRLVAMSPPIRRKYHDSVAFATGCRKIKNCKWKRCNRKIRIPIGMWPCRVEEKMTLKEVDGKTVEEIETKIIAKDGTVTRVPGEFQGYETSEEEPVEQPRRHDLYGFVDHPQLQQGNPMNEFAPHRLPQPEGNMNGWLMEDEEELERNEVDSDLESTASRKPVWKKTTKADPDRASRSTVPVESHHTPTCAPSTSQPHLSPTLRSSIKQETEVPQPSSPPHTNVADEAASTGVDVRYGGAVTTVTGLEAGQGSARMQHNELMDLVTKLSDRVVALETDLTQAKKVYGASFTKLINKVKRLEKNDKLSKSRRKLRHVLLDKEVYIRRSAAKTKDKEAGGTKRAAEEELGQQSSKKQKSDKLSQEEIQQLMIIVPEERMNIEALQTKYPIIDWEVYTEDSRMYWKIIRIWVEFKRLFEPDVDDELWKPQKHIHYITWILYDTCGVHHVSTKDGMDIYMLVEREYPLSRAVLTQMLVAKLLVEQNNEISR
ncbi:hypothetical protein Tco_1562983 [Tanacetum coccineum]